MLFEVSVRAIPLTLYTEQFVVQGTIHTRQHRVSDILNNSEAAFIVMEDVSLEEFGSNDLPLRAEFAQVNLSSILFAVALTAVEPARELRTPKVVERALVSIPPFRVIGNVHLLPDRNLRDGLSELRGRFLPVTDAQFWSDSARVARQSAPMVAVNHERAQIVAPFREVDPWSGLPGGHPSRAKVGADDDGGGETA
jgi:hypothetical protein